MDNTPAPHTLPPSSSAPPELHAAWDVIQRYAMPVVIGLGIGLAAILTVGLIRSKSETARRDALMLLGSARSFDDLERVATDYAKTPAAPLALLKLAQAHYASGNYAMAGEKYAAFRDRHGDHPLLPAAEMGAIQCLEAMGRLPEALTAYQAYATLHAGNFLAPEAVFGQARCLEEMNRLTEARIVYETFIAAQADGESPWASRAEDALRRVNARALKAQRQPTALNQD